MRTESRGDKDQGDVNANSESEIFEGHSSEQQHDRRDVQPQLSDPPQLPDPEDNLKGIRFRGNRKHKRHIWSAWRPA